MNIRKSIFLFLFIIIILSCGGSEKDKLSLESFSFPVDLVYDSTNMIVYVISSNFDLGYEYGNVKGISLSRLNPLLKNVCKDQCSDYNKQVILNEGISIGDYAGHSISYNNKIFVPLRKDNKIAVIETDNMGNLSCGSARKMLGDCDGGHLISTEYSEPFSMVDENKGDCIYVSFLKSGKVLCLNKDKFLLSQTEFADFTNGYEIGGIKDIDISKDGLMVSAYGYLMSGRNAIPLSYEFNGNRYTVFLDFTDQIGTAFQESVKISSQKKRFFISLRGPDLLLSVDYDIYKDGTFIVTDYRLLSLYRYPSRLYVATPMSSGRELLLAAMVDEDRIFIYDTENLTLLSEISDGLDGPYAMQMIDIENEDYLFVGNFENSTISVYRFISQENRFEYILRIGKPRSKEKGEY